MGDKEKPVDSLATPLTGMDCFTTNLNGLYQFNPIVSALQKANMDAILHEAHEAARIAMEESLKAKLTFREPGELSRLMDKFLEVVAKA